MHSSLTSCRWGLYSSDIFLSPLFYFNLFHRYIDIFCFNGFTFFLLNSSVFSLSLFLSPFTFFCFLYTAILHSSSYHRTHQCIHERKLPRLVGYAKFGTNNCLRDMHLDFGLTQYVGIPKKSLPMEALRFLHLVGAWDRTWSERCTQECGRAETSERETFIFKKHDRKHLKVWERLLVMFRKREVMSVDIKFINAVWIRHIHCRPTCHFHFFSRAWGSGAGVISNRSRTVHKWGGGGHMENSENLCSHKFVLGIPSTFSKTFCALFFTMELKQNIVLSARVNFI